MSTVVRYMGSKRALAPAIAGLIDAEHPNTPVLDAFSGMCAVGTQLAPQHPVVANDIHEFAATVARALFTAVGRRPSRKAASAELMPWYQRNADRLGEAIETRLVREGEALARTDDGDWRRLMSFTLDELEDPVPRRLRGLPSISAYRRNSRRTPYSLFSMYFASAYFGVRQAMEIDSLRYAISRASDDRRDLYLYALIQACSHCAAAPGHFAQHLVPRDETNTRYVARMRRRSILARFWSSLSSISVPKCFDRAGNRVYRKDATALLQELAVSAPDDLENLVIYADPPYSKAQYSRYYHVLETLVLYDYPDATGKGRYRDDRFETDFSHAAQVEAAMQDFLQAAAATGAPLYLSYPRNGLLFRHGGELREMIRANYPRTRLAMTRPLNHSTMGGAPGAGAMSVTEDVYYGGWE